VRNDGPSEYDDGGVLTADCCGKRGRGAMDNIGEFLIIESIRSARDLQNERAENPAVLAGTQA
jgi:hypothetical protein